MALLATMAQGQDAPAPAPRHDEEQEQEQEQGRLQTLQQLENVIAWQNWRQWELREEGGAFGLDLAGKSISAYAEEFVFTEAVAAELRALREKAVQQSGRGDESGLRTTLDRAGAIALRQANQMGILASHFSAADVLAQHEALIAPLLARVPAYEQQRTRARLQLLQQQQWNDLSKRLRAAADDASSEAARALIYAYNDERGRLAEIVSREDVATGRQLPGRDVSRPCTPPHPAPSGSGRPSIRQSNLGLPAYPDEARRLGIEGRVILRARISAEGCPERLEVLVSIGHEPLDRSALDWGETLRFHPATSDGRPIAATYEFATTFRLYD